MRFSRSILRPLTPTRPARACDPDCLTGSFRTVWPTHMRRQTQIYWVIPHIRGTLQSET